MFVQDCFGGADPDYRLPIRIITELAWHSLFVRNMFIKPQNAEEYRRACIVEYPRKGIWSIGFVTSDASAEIEAKAKEKMINIFIANTPTPATGFLIMVPARDVILLDMKMEEALKYVISGGVLKPDMLPKEIPVKKEG